MTHQASDREKAEIGQLMLDLADVKRDLDATRHKAERQAKALKHVGTLAASESGIGDDQRWPTHEECRQTRSDIARLERRARDILRDLRNHSINPDAFELGLPRS